ncbi:PREDICTED: uncharacterized protein LOC104819104 [Tarenaya hassleriana]|uniref:uncharacterized protein LOC104819104 n=1 Tax=Tarenaya hassleriana TaxID=28532 RepID=UPI00053C1F4F|nr:PREDICTED: uncharacterized protein LOC104819104 [Tarenaya hassleriana]
MNPSPIKKKKKKSLPNQTVTSPENSFSDHPHHSTFHNPHSHTSDLIFAKMASRTKRTRTTASRSVPERSRAPRPGAIIELTPLMSITTVHGEPTTITPRDETQAELYRRLERQGVRPTRFVSPEIEQLGIQDQVRELFERLGWRMLFTAHELTYTRLTLEFLSSYDCYFPRNGNIEGAYMEFRLCNTEVRLTMGQFAEILAVPRGRTWKLPDIDIKEQMQPFWKAIADGDYNASKGQATSVYHPSLRYLQQFMSNCLFAKFAAGKITKTDILYIRLALKDLFEDDDWRMGEVDLASQVALYFRHLLKIPAQSPKPIYIGGIVSMIARHVGINLGIFTDIAEGETRLDLLMLKHKSYIDWVRYNTFYWFRKRDGTTYKSRLSRNTVPPLTLEGIAFPLAEPHEPVALIASQADGEGTTNDEDGHDAEGTTHNIDAPVHDERPPMRDATHSDTGPSFSAYFDRMEHHMQTLRQEQERSREYQEQQLCAMLQHQIQRNVQYTAYRTRQEQSWTRQEGQLQAIRAAQEAYYTYQRQHTDFQTEVLHGLQQLHFTLAGRPLVPLPSRYPIEGESAAPPPASDPMDHHDDTPRDTRE